jgi:hypothetical protein
VVVVGDDLTCEVGARALAAAGVGRLRFVRRTGPVSRDIALALEQSNPDVALETRAWPAAGPGWLAALSGASAVVRSGFDDDPMLRAAVRLGVPLVAARGRDDAVDVVSFRRHGPCPHAALDVPEHPGVPPHDGPGAVIAAHIAAAEVLVLLAGADAGEARARHVTIPIPGPTGDGVGDTGPRGVDIPWSPECFACGGTASEMSWV